VLGIFKYAGFFAANLNAVLATHFVVNIVLPVGISFYTFQTLSFTIDVYRKDSDVLAWWGSTVECASAIAQIV